MQENLNKNIQSNVFPHWRNHNSLKGKLLPAFEFESEPKLWPAAVVFFVM
jgi:hypothetical protein